METLFQQVRRYVMRILKKTLLFLKWFALSTFIWIVIIIVSAIFSANAPKNLESGAYTTDHFTVIYEEIDREQAKYVGDDLERNFERITSDLGVTDMPHIVVYLYSETSIEFKDRHNGGDMHIDNVGGFVKRNNLNTIYLRWALAYDSDKSVLTAFAEPSAISSEAQHEFTHLVAANILYEKALSEGIVSSRADWERECTYTGYAFCSTPVWFDEALAQYESNLRGGSDLLIDYPSRAQTIDPTTLTGRDRYTYGRLIAHYIAHTWGKESLRTMVLYGADTNQALGVSRDEFIEGFRTFAADYLKEPLLLYKHTGQVVFD